MRLSNHVSKFILIVPHFSHFLNANLNIRVALETRFQAHDQIERVPKKVQVLLLQWKKYVHHDHWQLKLIYNIEMIGNLRYENR